MIRTGLLLVAAAVAPVSAQSVTYTFTGLGSGELNGTTFVRTAYTITLHGNLADREMNLPGVMRLVASSATISIEGVAENASFLPALNVASNMNTDVLVLGNVNTNLALFVLDEAGFADYDLSAPFGPLTDGTPLATEQFVNIGTDAGVLSMQSLVSVTFEATPTPGVAGVLAVAGVFASRRRRGGC